MFCTHCGVNNSDSANYCFRCGKIISGDNRQTESNSVENTTIRKPMAIQAKRGVGGWLLLFCIYLVFISPLMKITALMLERGIAHNINHKELQEAIGFEAVVLFMLSIFSIAVGYQMWSKTLGALRNARFYLISSMAFTVAMPFIFSMIANLPLLLERSVIMAGMTYAIFSVGFHAVCLYYLHSSKRVRATYPMPDTHVRCPECRALVSNESSQCEYCGCRLIPQPNLDARNG